MSDWPTSALSIGCACVEQTMVLSKTLLAPSSSRSSLHNNKQRVRVEAVELMVASILILPHVLHPYPI